MQPQWTSNLKDKDEKERFVKYLYSSRGVIDRLLAITKQMESELDGKELSPEVYDSPSWANKQADNIGYRRCLRRIQTLLTLDQKETNG